MTAQALIKLTVILACLAIAADRGVRIAKDLLSPAVRTAPAAVAATTIVAPVKDLHQTLGVDFTASDKTILLLLDSSCAFSTKSMPFYRRLLEARSGPGRGFRVIVVSNQRLEAIRSYVNAHGVRPDGFVTVPPEEIPVLRTPTLTVVNAQGKVERVWTGFLSASDERAVVSVIGGRL